MLRYSLPQYRLPKAVLRQELEIIEHLGGDEQLGLFACLCHHGLLRGEREQRSAEDRQHAAGVHHGLNPRENTDRNCMKLTPAARAAVR